jgi:predicted nucleic acid-binding Zn ribbon protein
VKVLKPSEIWKKIPGYPRYEVSNMGNVRHIKHKRILKGGIPYNGYRQVRVSKNGENISKCVHQLVAMVFLGPKPIGYEISHKDNDKKNNRINNLEYITHEENCQSNRIYPKKYCAICGRQIIHSFGRKTCSRKCNHILHTTELKCSYCGDKFRRRNSEIKRARKNYPSKGENVFCSYSCWSHFFWEERI